MSCVKLSIDLHRQIRRIVLPTLVGSMTLVSGIAITLGWTTLYAHLGEGHLRQLVADYLWITFWILCAAFSAFVIGAFVVWLLSRSIAKPIALLANRANALTEQGGTAHLPENTRICEIDRLSRSFNRLFALQEQQSVELRTLIQNVLHDIKAPINHISEQAQCLYDGSCDPKAAAGIISEYSDKVLRLFETHAEIARNNSFAETQTATPQNITEIIRFMVELYGPVAEVKGVRFVGPDENKPLVLMGHKGKLERLVGNLVDNAIKFTPEGGSVVVTAAANPSDIVISVSDTGIGIPAESLPHVFDRYFRDKTAVAHAGYGLGLTMVRSVVTFYHGTIDCSSTPGRGTTFTVRLPRPKQT